MDAAAAGSNRAHLDAYWMPFTANRQFKRAPRLLASAKGMYYTSDDGRRILDGAAGLWCVNAGHGRVEIADAVFAQLQTLDYAPSFQPGHRWRSICWPLGRDCSKRARPPVLHELGIGVVDTALKIALAYQRAIGQGSRTRLVGRERGYHGVGFGGISVGGLVNNRRAFGALLPGVDHLRHTHDPARNAFTRGQPQHGARLADDLEQLVQLHGADTIAAVIVEPVAGSTGVCRRRTAISTGCVRSATRHGILLIFDEVITGFGRLGRRSQAIILAWFPT